MIDPKVIDKVKLLIARAVHASTPKEESRTSAVLACKLIVEHDIQLGEKISGLRGFLDVLESEMSKEMFNNPRRRGRR